MLDDNIGLSCNEDFVILEKPWIFRFELHVVSRYTVGFKSYRYLLTGQQNCEGKLMGSNLSGG